MRVESVTVNSDTAEPDIVESDTVLTDVVDGGDIQR